MKFFNIKSGAEMEVYDSHQIRAVLNMSDLGINASKGQDFGWRIAPEVAVELELMRENQALLAKIAAENEIQAGMVDDADLLAYYQKEEAAKKIAEAQKGERDNYAKYTSEYEKKKAALRKAAEEAAKKAEK